MTFQSGSLPGGNASLSEVRSRVGFPGLQRTLRRNLWGKAQTEGGQILRSGEGWISHYSGQLQHFSGKEYANNHSLLICLSVVGTASSEVLKLKKSIHKLEHQQCPVPPKYLFIILYVAFGRRGCSRIWLLSLQNNSIFRLYGILYHRI